MQTELSASLYITDPTQTNYAVFNNPSDPNFVGYITDITGFDSPEIRENAQNINAGDGGYHGAFYHGRRPWTVSGMIVPSTPPVARSQAMTRIDRVMNACTKNDGYLVYTPSDGIQRYLAFRKQQPQRITTSQGPAKDFQIAGVCRDWRFYSSGSANQSDFVGSVTGAGSFSGTNTQNGDALAPVMIRIVGPVTSPVVYNNTSGLAIDLWTVGGGITIPIGDACLIDLTGQYPQIYVGPIGYEYTGTNVYGFMNPTTSDLDIGMLPSGNTNSWTLQASGMAAGNSGLIISWNDAWN